MKFRLVELDSERNILKEYYRSPNVFTEEDFDELKKKCIEKYSKQLDFHNIFSNRKFEIQKRKIMYYGSDIPIQLEIITI